MTPYVNTYDSLAEVVQRLDEGGASVKVLAGGTGLNLLMQYGLVDVDELISVRSMSELRDIESVDGGVLIGGAVTLDEVATSEVTRRLCPALAAACRAVGNARIRNWATLAGNIAHGDYASDPPAVLVALGADCIVESVSGTRRESVDDLLVGYYQTSLEAGEVIRAIFVPAHRDRTEVYLRFNSRTAADRPCAGVAVACHFDGDGALTSAKVSVGAVSQRPLVLRGAADRLLGKRLNDAVIKEASALDVDRSELMSDIRGSANYRGQITEVLLRRALWRLAVKRSSDE